jgi:hypothetical protein
VEKNCRPPTNREIPGRRKAQAKQGAGVTQIVLQGVAVNWADGCTPKFPAAHLKVDLGIVPGAQQSPEISNRLQDEVIARTKECNAEAQVDDKVLGVSYHRKLYRGQHVCVYGTRKECNGTRGGGKHAARLQDPDGAVEDIQCSDRIGHYGEWAEGIQEDVLRRSWGQHSRRATGDLWVADTGRCTETY